MRPDDYFIRKRRYSCFFGTELEILLKGLKADTLILIGGHTDVCVHYTFVDGHQHDYFMRVVEDVVAGSSRAAHDAALNAMEYLQTGAAGRAMRSWTRSMPGLDRLTGECSDPGQQESGHDQTVPFRPADPRPHRGYFDRHCRPVEDLGYSSPSMPDHFHDQIALMALSAAAAVTSTLKVSTRLRNDYRHPIILAKEMATLDLISEGRVEFGIGARWMRTDYEQTGMEYDLPGSGSSAWRIPRSSAVVGAGCCELRRHALPTRRLRRSAAPPHPADRP